MNIEIRNTQDKGRCIFAKEAIAKDETYKAEGILLDEMTIPENSEIWMYTFATCHPHKVMLLLDWPSLMSNSRENANLKYKQDGENMAMIFTAKRDIEAGEELTINYGYDVYEHAQHYGINVDDWNNATIGG